MYKLILSLVLIVLFAACGGPAAPAIAIATKDSVKTTADSSEMTDEELAAAGTKADEYWGRTGLTGLSPALMAFVPAGYQVMDTCQGDLNLDTYPDYLLVLNVPGEDTVAHKRGDSAGPLKRPLIILTGQPDQSYKLAAQSDNAVYCSSCGGMLGDPYQQMVIKKGYFSIEHYGGSRYRWTRILTFKYSPADSTWLLHKDGHETEDTMGEEKNTSKAYTSKDFGKVTFVDFDIYKN